ncbi:MULTISPECIES: hypothetical protein [unclassified Sinorhizobium]|uniref:hypothetical protein n=1 Tax=unclassified Sinorhizobium TaxID=2613772 RepID=UPI0035250DBD
MVERSRSEKLKRLVMVQRHLEKMAENDLAETTRAREEVNQSIERVIDAIGSVDPVHRIFSQNYAERFGRLTLKDQQLSGMQKLHETRVLRERTKGDRLEDNMKDARELERREADDNAVYDIIDQQFATPASSKLQKP